MRGKMRSLVVLGLMASIVGCSVTGPITGTTEDGDKWAGTYYADLNEGTFEIDNGKTACNGTYNQLSTEITLDLIFTCDDGRIGSAKIQRTPDLSGGSGRIEFSDGLEGTVEFTPA